MFFKRLEMQGFKSFIDYTSLDFEPGITSIIGPNGCGKSNIVDAIRWVLGEQSAKALRGSRMEDIIFNGTDQRKAVSMAEVSLTVDNHDQCLPTEHAEVTVTRRTFRSGESEYLINKTPCRLRDIHDLFMDTGIGTNAYSILEQGKIDLIVSSKPTDRRFVFEEAAGISKYKARKEESLRKLEATEQNFLRINDIAVEVRRQIGSLERQVQKARRYQEAKQELTTLEVTLGRRELSTRRRELRQLEQHWEDEVVRIEHLENQRRQSEDALQELQQGLNQAEEGLSSAQAEVHRLQEELIKAEDFLESSALREHDLHIGVERISRELSELDAKSDTLQQQHSGALTALGTKTVELETSQNELASEEQRLNTLEDELKARAVYVQDQQARLLQIVDQMSSLRGTLKNLELRRGEYLQQIEKLEKRQAEIAEQKAASQEAHHRFHTEGQEIQGAISNLQAEQDSLTKEKEKLGNVLSTLGAMLDNFNTTMTQLTARLNWIEELKNGLEGYEAGAKAVLMEYHTSPERFPGMMGPLVNFIRTEARLEFALEAFLGHRLQYILVADEAEAFKAMAYLFQGNHGRATFIPVRSMTAVAADLISQVPSGPWMNQPGVIGPALEHTRIDERFRAIFEQLLEEVVLVDDAEAAQRARRAGAMGTLVTLQGEVYSADGWITGGSQDVRERGLLGREREIEELKSELIVLEKNLADARQEEALTQAKYEETVGSLETATTELHDLEIKAAQHEKSIENLEVQMAELQRQLDALGQEYGQFTQQMAQNLSDHEAAAQQLVHLELTDQKTQAELSDHQMAIEEYRNEYDRRSLRAGELRIAITAVEQQLHGLRGETERVVRELDELASQKSEKQAAWQRDQERLQALTQEKLATQTKLVDLRQQKDVQVERLAEVRQKREAMLARKTEQDALMRQVQGQLEQGRDALHHVELKKAQFKMELKSLETYLDEEYHFKMESGEEAAPEPVELAEPEAVDTEIRDRIKELKVKLDGMGTVNLVAMEEYDELQQRHQFLSKQLGDLKEARENLQKLITLINQESRARFSETFLQVRDQFREVFRRLFNGGEADLILVDENNLLESGIEIIARPPGKRPQNISLLSGGEKALTAIALLFAIFLIKPSPFCVFDEMDAPLDDINTSRFCRILHEFTHKSQFIIITHNKLTMETADVLYGVTMQESGVSQLISVKFKGEEKAAKIEPKRMQPAEQAVLN